MYRGTSAAFIRLKGIFLVLYAHFKSWLLVAQIMFNIPLVLIGSVAVPLTLAKDAPGKEILYPVAVAILGGLLSSTLLDIIVTSVVFRLLGRKALEQYRQNHSAPTLTSSADAPPFTPLPGQNPAPAIR